MGTRGARAAVRRLRARARRALRQVRVDHPRCPAKVRVPLAAPRAQALRHQRRARAPRRTALRGSHGRKHRAVGALGSHAQDRRRPRRKERRDSRPRVRACKGRQGAQRRDPSLRGQAHRVRNPHRRLGLCAAHDKHNNSPRRPRRAVSGGLAKPAEALGSE
eukprot:Amastigsp_a508375_80.p2 type:complete len:162 gc:universal Amastigsp_a508375_80:515-30(-)